MIKKPLLYGLALSTWLASFAAEAKDEALIELFKVLYENGSINEEQYNRIMELAESEEDEAPVTTDEHPEPIVASTDQQPSAEPQKEEEEEEDKPAPSAPIETNLNIRLNLDTAAFSGSNNGLSNNTAFRRAELVATGSTDDWDGILLFDIVDNSIQLFDAYVTYKAIESWRFGIGNYKEPFSMEELTSTQNTTFMERSLPVIALSPAYHFGTWANYVANKWTATAGVYSNAINGPSENHKQANQGFDVTGRFTYAPYFEPGRVLHLGAAYSYQQPKIQPNLDLNTKSIRYSTTPESFLADLSFTDTGPITNVSNIQLVGLEAATVNGPLSFQGEYISSSVNQKEPGDTLKFNGWYVFGSYFLTGESRPYDFANGAFTNVNPYRRAGAWELAARYSNLNLTDGPILGGKTRNVTLGVNWYFSDTMRIMFNNIYVNNDINANGDNTLVGDDNFKIYQMRFQVAF